MVETPSDQGQLDAIKVYKSSLTVLPLDPVRAAGLSVLSVNAETVKLAVLHGSTIVMVMPSIVSVAAHGTSLISMHNFRSSLYVPTSARSSGRT